jgi:hypothetical protein
VSHRVDAQLLALFKDRCVPAGEIDRNSFCWSKSLRLVLYRGPDGKFYDPHAGMPHYVGRNARVLPIEFHPSGWRVAGLEYLLHTAAWLLRQPESDDGGISEDQD